MDKVKPVTKLGRSIYHATRNIRIEFKKKEGKMTKKKKSE